MYRCVRCIHMYTHPYTQTPLSVRHEMNIPCVSFTGRGGCVHTDAPPCKKRNACTVCIVYRGVCVHTEPPPCKTARGMYMACLTKRGVWKRSL